MTEKQEKILETALELFAKEGYKSTSTSKIAKQANVSEGLIFRHFENKEGLLQAIISLGEEKAKILFADIVMDEDPKSVIRKILGMGEQMNQDPASANFWKLQYKLKWELEIYGAYKLEPLRQALATAFQKLDYDHPVVEADLLLVTLDGLATRFYLDKEFDFSKIVELLFQKYGIWS